MSLFVFFYCVDKDPFCEQVDLSSLIFHDIRNYSLYISVPLQSVLIQLSIFLNLKKIIYNAGTHFRLPRHGRLMGTSVL